jgi:hypothetical protein
VEAGRGRERRVDRGAGDAEPGVVGAPARAQLGDDADVAGVHGDREGDADVAVDGGVRDLLRVQADDAPRGVERVYHPLLAISLHQGASCGRRCRIGERLGARVEKYASPCAIRRCRSRSGGIRSPA